jgi:hypothetical protein
MEHVLSFVDFPPLVLDMVTEGLSAKSDIESFTRACRAFRYAAWRSASRYSSLIYDRPTCSNGGGVDGFVRLLMMVTIFHKRLVRVKIVSGTPCYDVAVLVLNARPGKCECHFVHSGRNPLPWNVIRAINASTTLSSFASYDGADQFNAEGVVTLHASCTMVHLGARQDAGLLSTPQVFVRQLWLKSLRLYNGDGEHVPPDDFSTLLPSLEVLHIGGNSLLALQSRFPKSLRILLANYLPPSDGLQDRMPGLQALVCPFIDPVTDPSGVLHTGVGVVATILDYPDSWDEDEEEEEDEDAKEDEDYMHGVEIEQLPMLKAAFPSVSHLWGHTSWDPALYEQADSSPPPDGYTFPQVWPGKFVEQLCDFPHVRMHLEAPCYVLEDVDDELFTFRPTNMYFTYIDVFLRIS